jgi:membrane protease subunit HflK
MDGPKMRKVDLGDFRPPNIRIGMLLLIGLGILGAWVAFDSVYTVEPEEAGIVLTFGKFSASTPPGLHFKFPRPLQTVLKVPIQRQLKLEFGFRTEEAGVRSRYSNADFSGESLMLTGDLNVASVSWITQYRVDDPYKFLFKVRNIIDTFADMNEAVMRSVIGDRSINEVLTTGRQEIATLVEVQLQELCDKYDSGIRVDQIILQDVTVPDEVKPSFNEVNEAQQQRNQKINVAETEYNKVVPRARGEAQQMIQQAEGYKVDRINRAEGEAAAFTSVLEAYRRSPEVTRQRIYLETMAKVLPQIKRKVIVDKDMKGLLPLLSLDGGVK